MSIATIVELLGGPKILKRTVGTASDLVEVTRHGLPAGILPALASNLSLDRRAVAQAVGIPERTLSRRLSTGSRLSAAESDRTVRLARILALASDTLGDLEKASMWLQTPNRVLEGHAPFDLLDTDAGSQSVETVLGRIAYGVYS
jgi:putative toxin-antitoxin system antitoxin component (TIGR02293 family)